MDRKKQEDKLGKRGERYLLSGKYHKALSAFCGALKIAAERGDKYAESIWLSNIGSTHIQFEEYNEAQKYFEEALPISIELGIPELEMHIRNNLAIVHWEEGHLETSKEHLDAGLKIARTVNNRRVEASLSGMLGNVYSSAEDYDKAKDYYDYALSIATDLKDTMQIGILTGNIGNNLLSLGETEKAIEHFEKALEISKQVGDSFNRQRWEQNLSKARAALYGKENPEEEAKQAYELALWSQENVSPEEAIELWSNAARLCRRVRDYRHCGDGLCNAGVILNRQGSFKEADLRFEEALDVYRIVDDHRRIGLVYLNQGISQNDRGNSSIAASLIEKAVELLRGFGNELELGEAFTALADIYIINNENSRATAILGEAEHLYRDIDNHEELAKTLLRLGEAVREKEPNRAMKLLNDSIELATAENAIGTLAIALVSLSTLLESQGKTEEAIRNLQESTAQVIAEAPYDISAKYLLLLGTLLKQIGNEAEAFKIWNEALAISEKNEDSISTVQALGEICIAFAQRLKVLRTRYYKASPQNADDQAKVESSPDMPNFAQNLRGDIRLIALNSQDDAFELMQMMMQSQSDESFLRIIHVHASEFNEVFFSSLLFNVQRAIEDGDNDRAEALEQLARVIAESQQQALSIAETFSEQLLKDDQELIIHLEPGDRLIPRSEDITFNRRAAEVIYRDGLNLLAMQKPKEALDRFQNALEFFELLGEPSTIANCLGNLAFCASIIGDFGAGIKFGHHALSRFSELKDPSRAAQSLLILGEIEHKRYQFEQALQYFKQAYQLAHEARNPTIEGSAMSNIGAMYGKIGQNEIALQWLEEALKIKRENSEITSLVSTLLNLKYIYTNLNYPEKSERALDEVRNIIKNSEDKSQLAAFLNNLAADHIRRHEICEAESLLYEAKQIADEAEDPYLQSFILPNLILALGTQGKWAELEQALDAAAEIEEGLGNNIGIRNIMLLRADAAMLKGMTEAAIHAYEEVYIKYKDTLSQMETLAILYKLWKTLSSIGDFDRATQYKQRLENVTQPIIDTEITEDNLSLFVKACEIFSALANAGEADEQKALSLLAQAIDLTKVAGDMEGTLELFEERASILRIIGRLEESIEFHQLALDMATKMKDDFLRATILVNMGTALREIGKLNDSELTYHQALDLARRQKAFGLQAHILEKAITVMFDLGKYEELEGLARECIDICRYTGDHVTEARVHIMLVGLLMDDNPEVAKNELLAALQDEGISKGNKAEALGVLALTLRELHQYDESIERIEEAISIGGVTAIEQATLHYYAGVIYMEAGQSEIALDQSEKSMKLISHNVASHLSSNIRQLRGDILKKNGDLNSAYREYRAGMDYLELLRGNISREQDQLRSLSVLAIIPEKLVDVLIDMGNMADAFSALEAAKSRSFLERLRLVELQAPQTIPFEKRSEEVHLIELMRSLEERINTSTSLTKKERWISEYNKAASDHSRLLNDMSRIAPDFVELRRGSTLSFEEVLKIL